MQGRFGDQHRRSQWTRADHFAPASGRLGTDRPRGAAAGSGWSWKLVGSLWLGAAVLGTAYGVGSFGGQAASSAAARPSTSATSGIRAAFSLCHSGGGYNCVVDGDTIWLEGTKVRIADIDTPETHEPRCASEKALGDKATRRLQALLNSGAITTLSIDRDEDRYGRKLRLVMVDGASVGEMLVREGLARPYAGGRRPWCRPTVTS